MAELHAAGLTTYQISLARKCCLKRVRRGVYVVALSCPNPEHELLSRLASSSITDLPMEQGGLRKKREEHRILVRSFVGALPPNSMFSHMSALIVHGLPVPYFQQNVPLRVETIHPRHSVRSTTMLIRQRVCLDTDSAVVDGIPVTSLLRTLWDIGRDYPLPFSVAVGDAAIHNRLTTTEELASYCDSHPARTHQNRIDLMREHIDGRRESIGESICAIRFVEYAITGFEPQVEFFNEYGDVEARPDFTHKKAKVIAEFDGEGKYYLSGDDPKRAFERERRREYRLRNRGYTVFRIRWADLFSADLFLRIKACVERNLAEGPSRRRG
ncbi:MULTISPECIES: hypothetical protein [Brevibacterium]|nr:MULTISPECIES: hypothetical protein [Brevibacterium]